MTAEKRITVSSFVTGVDKDLKLIIKSGINVDKVDEKTGRTAIHDAVANGNENCTKILIDAGAKINTQDKTGETPIMTALLYGNHIELRSK